MCCTKPPAILPPPKEYDVYVRGGRGNARLIGWSNNKEGFEWLRETPKSPPINLTKQHNPNHSLLSKPMTVRRKGRIIRYKSSSKGS